jgi:hypothetical protein
MLHWRGKLAQNFTFKIYRTSEGENAPRPSGHSICSCEYTGCKKRLEYKLQKIKRWIFLTRKVGVIYENFFHASAIGWDLSSADRLLHDTTDRRTSGRGHLTASTHTEVEMKVDMLNKVGFNLNWSWAFKWLNFLGSDPIENTVLSLLHQPLLRACALPSNVYGYTRSVHVTILWMLFLLLQ